MVLFYPVAKPVALLLDVMLGQELRTVYSKEELVEMLEIHVRALIDLRELVGWWVGGWLAGWLISWLVGGWVGCRSYGRCGGSIGGYIWVVAHLVDFDPPCLASTRHPSNQSLK
jgi:hypothetical protein